MITRFELRQIEAEPEASGDDPIVVEATGEVDATNAADLRAALREIGVLHPLVLDLNGMEYFDSAGFAVLDGLLAQRPIAIVVAPAAVLRRAATLMELPLYDTVEQARTALIRERRAPC
ncbi:MAG: STAS domain-containing protein [Solirubrobacteraceae bacterium]